MKDKAELERLSEALSIFKSEVTALSTTNWKCLDSIAVIRICLGSRDFPQSQRKTSKTVVSNRRERGRGQVMVDAKAGCGY